MKVTVFFKPILPLSTNMLGSDSAVHASKSANAGPIPMPH
jgi:hypothetical protein